MLAHYQKQPSWTALKKMLLQFGQKKFECLFLGCFWRNLWTRFDSWFLMTSGYRESGTTWKGSVFGDVLVRTFTNLDWIRRDTLLRSQCECRKIRNIRIFYARFTQCRAYHGHRFSWAETHKKKIEHVQVSQNKNSIFKNRPTEKIIHNFSN